ncbi:SDR family NAD(P)-dependent oxidoreductase [Thalassomonas sp. M1454]|uniref:SDR family NAD(P)-dependent oxidoreductase n=1 Tax=Thalassomonas sp. M1454 TaxID=2594477 RepID=UPI00117C0E0E|nr:SDR family NAD(P)-dependent oxidoreductase [Thalassomonas sp. M1454]TRX55031.1 SDR family NAD(P)-dependent oxidoreductase [Thalassomonas sp. M1454]
MTAQKIALVTGANRGIGLAISQKLAEQDMHVIMTARDKNLLQQECDTLKSAGYSVEGHVLDVTGYEQANALIAQLIAKHQRIDVLINNAGIAVDQWVPGSDVSMDVVKQTMETNCFASLNLIQQVLPHMKTTGYGRIVNMSTELASLEGMQMGMTLAYRASKAALNCITKIFSIELADYADIKINAAAPGWVKTNLGGDDAELTPEQGADTPVWLATLGSDGPSGDFYRERKVYPW